MILSDLSFPTRERGLKYNTFRIVNRRRRCRSPRGNVDWNHCEWKIHTIGYSRSPRGNVDWNVDVREDAHAPDSVVPHAGTWIEIALSHAWNTRDRCRSPRGNVDWNMNDMLLSFYDLCCSLRGNTDQNQTNDLNGFIVLNRVICIDREM